jgi:hypothetical protein
MVCAIEAFSWDKTRCIAFTIYPAWDLGSTGLRWRVLFQGSRVFLFHFFSGGPKHLQPLSLPSSPYKFQAAPLLQPFNEAQILVEIAEVEPQYSFHPPRSRNCFLLLSTKCRTGTRGKQNEPNGLSQTEGTETPLLKIITVP